MSDTQSKGITGNQITTTSSHNQIDDMPLIHPLCGTLPIASAAYRGHSVYVAGNGTTTADVQYICLMSATGTYSWKVAVSG